MQHAKCPLKWIQHDNGDLNLQIWHFTGGLLVIFAYISMVKNDNDNGE
jgi:hypothetical protein